MVHGGRRRQPPQKPLAGVPRERSYLAGEAGLARLRSSFQRLPASRGCWHCLGTCYKQFRGQEATIIQWRHMFLSLPPNEQDCELGIMFQCRSSGGWDELLPTIKDGPKPALQSKQMTGVTRPKSCLPGSRPNQLMGGQTSPMGGGDLEASSDGDGSASSATMPSPGSSSEQPSWSRDCSMDTEPRSVHTSSSERSDATSQASWSDEEEGRAPGQRPARQPARRASSKHGRRARLSFAFLGKQVCQELN